MTFSLEQGTGVEPASEAWEATIIADILTLRDGKHYSIVHWKMQAEIFDRVRGLFLWGLLWVPGNGAEMRAGLGVGIPVFSSGVGAVPTADQVVGVFAEFDIVGNIMDALGAVGIVHDCFLLWFEEMISLRVS